MLIFVLFTLIALSIAFMRMDLQNFTNHYEEMKLLEFKNDLSTILSDDRKKQELDLYSDLLQFAEQNRNKTINLAGIKLERNNGLEDHSLIEFYWEEIQDIYNYSSYQHIRIDSYDIDLNNDGFVDRIVLFESSLHCGSAGCMVNILLNNNDYEYTKIFNATIQVLSQSTDIPDAEFFVSNVNTNGFYNVIIKHYDIVIAEIVYNGVKYDFTFYNKDYRAPVY